MINTMRLVFSKKTFLMLFFIFILPLSTSFEIGDIGCCAFPGTPVSNLCTGEVDFQICCYDYNNTEIPGCSDSFYKDTSCNELITGCTLSECCCNTNNGKSSMMSPNTCIYDIIPDEIALTCPTACEEAMMTVSQSDLISTIKQKNGTITGNQCFYYYNDSGLGSLNVGVIDIFPEVIGQITAAEYQDDLLMLFSTTGDSFIYDNQLQFFSQSNTMDLLNEPSIDSIFIYSGGDEDNKYLYTTGPLLKGDGFRDIMERLRSVLMTG